MKYEISSIKQFYSALLANNIFSDTSSDAWKRMQEMGVPQNTFFRGQLSKYQTISSSISRSENLTKNEHQIYLETIYTKEKDLSLLKFPIEKLSKMQHYAIPTRLADFSIDPLVALFFAVSGGNAEESGNVYVFQRNARTIQDVVPQMISLLGTLENLSVESVITEYSKVYGDSLDRKTVLQHINEVVFLEYSKSLEYSNERLHGQKGTFAIFGNELDEEENISSIIKNINVNDADITITIPGVYKQVLLNELKVFYHITDFVVYPELTTWAEYMKEKYDSKEYNVDSSYWIINSELTDLPYVSYLKIQAILSKPVNSEELKKIGEQIFEEHMDSCNAIEIQLYSSFDNYTVRHWTAQCRWTSENLALKDRPFLYTNEENNLLWELSSNLTTRESYNNDEIFKDPADLFFASHKNYIILLKLYNEISTALDEMEDKFQFSSEVMSRRHTITQCCEMLFNFGRAKDNNIDAFLCKHKNFACLMNMISLVAEHYEKYDTQFWYMIDVLINECSISINDIRKCMSKWAPVFAKENTIEKLLNEEVLLKKLKFSQTKPVSANAVKVAFDVNYSLRNDKLHIFVKTNLFDGAKLSVSIEQKYGIQIYSTERTVKNGFFEIIAERNLFVANHYTLNIMLGYPRTQSTVFVAHAGQEYENLEGKCIDHSGIDSDLSYHDFFKIELDCIHRTDFKTC